MKTLLGFFLENWTAIILAEVFFFALLLFVFLYIALGGKGKSGKKLSSKEDELAENCSRILSLIDDLKDKLKKSPKQGGADFDIEPEEFTTLKENLLDKNKEIERLEGELKYHSEKQPSGSGIDNDKYVEIAQEKASLETKVKEMEFVLDSLQTAMEGAEAGGASSEETEELQEKVSDLEARLFEYSVIEEELADLKRIKEENEKLRDEVQRQMEQSRQEAPRPAVAEEELLGMEAEIETEKVSEETTASTSDEELIITDDSAEAEELEITEEIKVEPQEEKEEEPADELPEDLGDIEGLVEDSVEAEVGEEPEEKEKEKVETAAIEEEPADILPADLGEIEGLIEDEKTETPVAAEKTEVVEEDEPEDVLPDDLGDIDGLIEESVAEEASVEEITDMKEPEDDISDILPDDLGEIDGLAGELEVTEEKEEVIEAIEEKADDFDTDSEISEIVSEKPDEPETGDQVDMPDLQGLDDIIEGKEEDDSKKVGEVLSDTMDLLSDSIDLDAIELEASGADLDHTEEVGAEVMEAPIDFDALEGGLGDSDESLEEVPTDEQPPAEDPSTEKTEEKAPEKDEDPMAGILPDSVDLDAIAAEAESVLLSEDSDSDVEGQNPLDEEIDFDSLVGEVTDDEKTVEIEDLTELSEETKTEETEEKKEVPSESSIDDILNEPIDIDNLEDDLLGDGKKDGDE